MNSHCFGVSKLNHLLFFYGLTAPQLKLTSHLLICRCDIWWVNNWINSRTYVALHQMFNRWRFAQLIHLERLNFVMNRRMNDLLCALMVWIGSVWICAILCSNQTSYGLMKTLMRSFRLSFCFAHQFLTWTKLISFLNWMKKSFIENKNSRVGSFFPFGT